MRNLSGEKNPKIIKTDSLRASGVPPDLQNIVLKQVCWELIFRVTKVESKFSLDSLRTSGGASDLKKVKESFLRINIQVNKS